MVDDVSYKDKNVIRLKLVVEMFSCCIIFALNHYWFCSYIVHINVLQISTNCNN